MHTKSPIPMRKMLDSPALDPALASDKAFLLQKLAEAKASGGYTFGFASASQARSARRRMYHVISQMDDYNRKLFEAVELKLKGRMIAMVPKLTLSSVIIQAKARAGEISTGNSEEENIDA